MHSFRLNAASIALVALTCLLPKEAAAEWKNVDVPAAWKKGPGGSGYAWYRCQVNVPAGWKSSSVELWVEAVDDAREAYFNGTRLGAHGSFPPKYASGLGADARWKVPATAIRFGQPNLLAIRVFARDGRTNFNVAAPALFGGDQAIRLAGKWQVQIGDDASWAKPTQQLAGLEPFSNTQPAADVEKTLKKLEGEEGPLSPAESRARMTVPDDLDVELVLSEPEIGQPLSMRWDERGRLWVVQYLQYPNPAGLKMVSRDKFLRTVYDKVPPPPPNHFRGADKITIHEDTDGDGIPDKHKTFVEGLNMVSAVAIGRGGVWVLNPPYLLFYADKDHDDRPDGDPEVLLSGFGIEDSHSVVNNLRFGPDGWLYAAQGSTVTGNVIRTGIDKKPYFTMGQLIWRYHPERKIYEVFAEGGGNTFGVELDSKGRIYSGHNGGDTRGFHYVQGGYYRKGFGKHGELSNPYTFGYFNAMQHAKVPRFTHTFLIYEDNALPAKYRGKLFGDGPLQSHVVISDVQPNGSSFATRDVGYAIQNKDTWFRPVDIQAGPDGNIYVADFYEQRIDHASHYQGRVDPGSGRIWRIKAKGVKPAKPFDLGKLSTADLIQQQQSPIRWRRQEVLRLLGDRKDKAAIPLLLAVLQKQTGQTALEALWGLYVSGGFDENVAAKLLAHDDPFVRLWTVRLACDDHQVSDALAKQMATVATQEANVEVRSQLACSAKRLPAKPSLAIVHNLLGRSEDNGDIHLPLLLWWAIEAKCEKDRDAILEMFADKALWSEPIVREHVLERLMRRFARSGTRRDLLTCAELLKLAPQPELAQRLMKGFEQAYEGRALVGLPDELVAEIAKVGGISLALRLRQADPQAIAEAEKITANEKAPNKERVQYLQIFGQIRQPQLVPKLLDVVEHSKQPEVQSAALGALQSYRDPQIVERVIKLHDKLTDDDVRTVGQTLLAARKDSALALLQAIDAGQVDPKKVSGPIVRKLLFHHDERIKSLVEKHFGKIQGATTEQMRAEVDRLAQLISGASGDPYPGRQLFSKTCGKCHRLFGDGGQIGPDLTSYKRDDLRHMLLNVVNPSAEIREGYENYMVITADGRVLNGFVADRDKQVVVLKGIDGQSTVIPADDIDEMQAVPRSLMPENVLKDFNEQQIRDLFAYLRSTQPLP